MEKQLIESKNKKNYRSIVFVRGILGFSNVLLITLLPLVFLQDPYNFSSKQIVSNIFIFGLFSCGFEVITPLFIKKFGFRRCVLLGCFICCAMLNLLSVISYFPVILAILALFGAGYSFVSFGARLFIMSEKDSMRRFKGFGNLYRILNVSAGLALLVVFFFPYKEFPNLILRILSFSYLLSIAVLFFFFHPSPLHEGSVNPIFSIIFKKDFFKDMNWEPLFYLSLMFAVIYGTFQSTVLPYYSELFHSVEPWLGWVLALDPLMVVLFQPRVSQLFHILQKKYNDSGFLLGLCFAVASFIIPIFGFSYISLLFFVIFFTLAEMLIFPHIDYMISLVAAEETKTAFISITGLLMGLGRIVSQTFGLWLVGYLASYQLSENWFWIMNVMVFSAFFFFILFKMNFIVPSDRSPG